MSDQSCFEEPDKDRPQSAVPNWFAWLRGMTGFMKGLRTLLVFIVCAGLMAGWIGGASASPMGEHLLVFLGLFVSALLPIYLMLRDQHAAKLANRAGVAGLLLVFSMSLGLMAGSASRLGGWDQMTDRFLIHRQQDNLIENGGLEDALLSIALAEADLHLISLGFNAPERATFRTIFIESESQRPALEQRYNTVENLAGTIGARLKRIPNQCLREAPEAVQREIEIFSEGRETIQPAIERLIETWRRDGQPIEIKLANLINQYSQFDEPLEVASAELPNRSDLSAVRVSECRTDIADARGGLLQLKELKTSRPDREFPWLNQLRLSGEEIAVTPAAEAVARLANNIERKD